MPLRFGAGVKGKVLEAIRYGVPLVTTSIGAEGIPDALEVMRVADEPEVFAQSVLDELQGSAKLQGDREAWLKKRFGRTSAEAALKNHQRIESKTNT